MTEALSSYDRAIALENTDAIAHYNRALLMQDCSQWEEALAGYNRAISIDPGYADAQYNRSLALLFRGDFESGVSFDNDSLDFAKTADLCNCMDLVISVDSSVAHLSGALGLKTWVLLPFIPDWRWMRDRNDSPWYPTMKLYRQRIAGDWNEVLGRVADDLRREYRSSADADIGS